MKKERIFFFYLYCVWNGSCLFLSFNSYKRNLEVF